MLSLSAINLACQNFPGGSEPVSSKIELIQCPAAGKPLLNTSTFTLDSGQLKVGTGMCITPSPPPGVQLWSKPLAHGKVAILLVNVLNIAQNFSLPLADVPGLGCSSNCTARDVWNQEGVTISGDHLDVELAVHESAFYIFG